MIIINLLFTLSLFINCNVECYKILGVFPGNGRSHHIFFTSLMEELASRNHDVTVINYLPMKNITNLRQISLLKENFEECIVDMTHNLNTIPASMFVDFYRAYDMAVLFKEMAEDNCQRIVSNAKIKDMILNEKFDLVIVEQFVTDCGLAVAYKLNAPTVGIAAHMLMPWTYSRLGAPNNPAFVPNHLCATGTRPTILNKIKSGIINMAMTAYYKYIIQTTDQKIINEVYPDVPDLESLGNNVSLVMVNQYFPLTGARLQGPNVVEIGGMHVERHSMPIEDMELKSFLDSSTEDIVYISFGSIASNFPIEVLDEIRIFIEKSTQFKFVWKTDLDPSKFASKNVLIRKWLPQPTVLCHPKVVAFVSHSGMLSTSEAMYCGVPMVSVPLFGDQFSNSAAAVEKGLAVAIDIYSLNRNTLQEALNEVIQKRFKERAKQLSKLWRDRPLSPMNTAVFWIELAARHKGLVDMKPSSAHLNMFEYLLLDIILLISIVFYTIYRLFVYVLSFGKTKKSKTKQKVKRN